MVVEELERRMKVRSGYNRSYLGKLSSDDDLAYLG